MRTCDTCLLSLSDGVNAKHQEQSLLAGDPKLLTHGVDQYGFVCGSNNTYNGTVVDLTEQKYLYYLDPFSLLNTSNLPWAASICVSECPSVEDLCEVTSLPCRKSTQYRCVLQPQSYAILISTAPVIWTCQTEDVQRIRKLW